VIRRARHFAAVISHIDQAHASLLRESARSGIRDRLWSAQQLEAQLIEPIVRDNLDGFAYHP